MTGDGRCVVLSRTQVGRHGCLRALRDSEEFVRADARSARARGLEPGGGMLIDSAPSVHMFFMRFPIDVVFLDRDWRVLSVRHELRPWRIAGARRAVAALELPAEPPPQLESPREMCSLSKLTRGDASVRDRLLRSISERPPSRPKLWSTLWDVLPAVQGAQAEHDSDPAGSAPKRSVKRWERAALLPKSRLRLRGATVPVAFRTMIDGWAGGPIVQHVH